MERNTIPVNGPMEILIVTHAKDLPWLEYCLRSIEKFCTGFQGVTVAMPRHEENVFVSSLFGLSKGRQFNLIPINLHPYDEVPGKGMIQHMVKMAEADTIVPPETKWVLTCDADCIFTMPTTPEDYFTKGKPYYLVRTWESLIRVDANAPGGRVISDCYQWKAPTEAQLGFPTTLFTMCMNTNVFPIEFFGHYRAHVEKVQGKPFADWMLEGRNAFPQDRMDHTAMGAWGYQFMREWWEWIDVDSQPYPVDRKRAYWSHGGIHPHILAEIEGFLRWEPTPEEEVRMAQ